MPDNWNYIKVGDQLYVNDEDNNKLYLVSGPELIEVLAPTKHQSKGGTDG